MAPNGKVVQFQAEASADQARGRIAMVLTRAGGRITAMDPAMIPAEVGNGERAQFRGVWATKPIDLPISLVIGFIGISAERCGVHATMTDGLVGLRIGTRSKYEATFDAWAEVLQLAANGAALP